MDELLRKGGDGDRSRRGSGDWKEARGSFLRDPRVSSCGSLHFESRLRSTAVSKWAWSWTATAPLMSMSESLFELSQSRLAGRGTSTGLRGSVGGVELLADGWVSAGVESAMGQGRGGHGVEGSDRQGDERGGRLPLLLVLGACSHGVREAGVREGVGSSVVVRKVVLVELEVVELVSSAVAR